MGFDDGPDSLPLGFFEPFGGEAKPGGKPLLAPNPPSELIVGFHHSRLTIDPVTVQETGRLMASFRSNATGTPDRLFEDVDEEVRRRFSIPLGPSPQPPIQLNRESHLEVIDVSGPVFPIGDVPARGGGTDWIGLVAINR